MANYNIVIHGEKTRNNLRYKECLHNLATKIMANNYNLDAGCGKFEANGKEGTLGSAYCAACFCHRSFHKMVEEKLIECSSDELVITRLICPTNGDSPVVQAVSKTQAQQRRPRLDPHVPVVPQGTFRLNKQLRDMNNNSKKKMDMGGNKKKPRMRATLEQKGKLKIFAEKKGWKFLKHEEKNEDVNQFCSEIGITVQFLKNWIRNNRRKMALKLASIDLNV